MVIVKVTGIKCRALVDPGASSVYASATLIEKIKKKPWRTEYRNIEMIIHLVTRNIKIYHVEESNVEGNHSIDVELKQYLLLSLSSRNRISFWSHHMWYQWTSPNLCCKLKKKRKLSDKVRQMEILVSSRSENRLIMKAGPSKKYL